MKHLIILFLCIAFGYQTKALDTVTVYFKSNHWVRKNDVFIILRKDKVIKTYHIHKNREEFDSLKIVIDSSEISTGTLDLKIYRRHWLWGWRSDFVYIPYLPDMKYLLLYRDPRRLKRKFAFQFLWSNVRPKSGYSIL